MELDLKKIKPKDIKISDKYSANLYKFLKKTGYGNVYFNTNNGTMKEKETIELDWNNLRAYNIFIGSNIMDDTYNMNDENINFGQVIAKRLNSILSGVKIYQTGAYCAFGHYWVNRDWIDITEEFWKRYEQIGRCLFIDHDGWCQDDNNTRFKYIDEDTRICNWCGKTEHRRIKEVVKHKEIWE
jgi:hypothetical protein